jgi:hypothetical protein
MERARWNTELLHKKLNFVNPSNFWGSLQNFTGLLYFIFYFYFKLAICAFT